MKKQNLKNFCVSAAMLTLFVLWTVLVKTVDVRPLGAEGTSIGFSAVNLFVHKLVGTNMTLYTITDWLGLVPIAFALGFALLGLAEWIRRKSLFKVDARLFVLGAFYVAVVAVFLFFEEVIINYRPVLIEGVLEASYPSSTTMLSLCIMPTSAFELGYRIKNKPIKTALVIMVAGFTAFMVIGRLASGVHWLSDIIGGVLVSAGLVSLYISTVKFISNKKEE